MHIRKRFIAILLIFTINGWAGYFDSCPQAGPIDRWSQRPIPSLNVPCERSDNPLEQRAQAILNRIVEANISRFHNPEVYRNICVKVNSAADNNAGIAKPEISQIHLSTALVESDPSGNLTAAIIAHELAHMMQEHLCSARYHYYHPELMASPEYRTAYRRLQQEEANGLLDEISSLRRMQLQAEPQDQDTVRSAIRSRLYVIAQIDFSLLSQSDQAILREETSAESGNPQSLMSLMELSGSDQLNLSNHMFNDPRLEVRSRLASSLNAIASEHGINEELGVHHEFEADRVSYQLLSNTQYGSSSMTRLTQYLFREGSLFSDNWGATSFTDCHQRVAQGEVPALRVNMGMAHPPVCRRYYEMAVKMPLCERASSTTDNESVITVE
jgi:hypothetical protein